MDVAMAVPALLKLQAPVPPLHGELGRMTALARDFAVGTLEGKRGLRMSTQPDLLGQPEPANASVAALTAISELRLVNLSVTSDTLRARARGDHISFVMTRFALRLCVTSGEAQTRVVSPDIGDLSPVGFVVAGHAFGPAEPIAVGVLVTRRAGGL